MSLKSSTGLRTKVLDTAPLKTVLALGFIDIYAIGTGTVPADADAAIVAGNIKLCRISNNATATGLTFSAVGSNGVIAKEASEVWSGTNLATGAAAFYRFVAPGDTGTLSTIEPRLQGLVGTAGAEMNLSGTSLTSGQLQTVDYYVVSLMSA